MACKEEGARVLTSDTMMSEILGAASSWADDRVSSHGPCDL